MKRHLALAWLLLGSALMLIPITVLLKASASDSISRAAAPALARLGDRATVHAEGRAAPRINLADGREVLTAYAGDPEAQRLLQQNLVQPLAMASSDFDEDGVPDLVSGYAAPNGGMLTLHRGNVDAIYPNTLDAQRRKAGGTFTDAPFLSPARGFETPRPVDFIGCGDFDADGHWDIVTAARGGSTLYFFLGDGRGNLSAPRQVDLPGRVTALVTGEINRADGLTDIVVGISGADGPKVMVFEAPDGALRANPEVFALPAEASALALGQFDDDFPRDLAVASGRELMIVRGQAQRPSLNKTKQAKTREAVIDRRSFPFAIKSLVIGDFSGNQRDDVALLFDVGAVHVLSRPAAVATRRGQKPLRVQEWQDKTLPGDWPQARLLDRARVSSLPVDNVVVIDSTNRRLQILTDDRVRRSIQASSITESLEVEGEPIAVLPMRLNADALSDLVILRSGQVAPSVAITAPAMTFIVINTNGSGAGSLPQAIIDANTTAGADLITFNVGVGPQTINLGASLFITEAVTIDATTQPGFAGNPIIELVGKSMTPDGLFVSGGGTTIRGFVINGFPGDAISLTTIGNNIVERNFIGTTMSGNASAPNGGNGVTVDGVDSNRIGGTTAAASNLISGNTGAGVEIINDSVANLVQGNFIGTDVTGSAALGNGNFGVALLTLVSNTTIGGTTPGARNLISANNNSGVVLFSNSTTGNLVQGNLIGTNAAGTAALPNVADGVSVTGNTHDNTIGGTIAAAGNIIAFNVGAGLSLNSGSGNAILGNSIFSNNFFGIDLGDDAGVTPNDACDGDPGPNGLQNFPVLTSANSSGGNTTIVGVLDSTPNTTFRIEFFSSPSCDSSGNGQGKTFLGSTPVTTPPSVVVCNVGFNVTLPVAVPAGNVITATATDPANNTSEFSACVTVVVAGCTITCPANQVRPNDSNQCGAVVTYPPPTTSGPCGTVTCAPASGSFFPQGTTMVTCNTGAGPSCVFNVTVNDTQPPTITCPPNQFVSATVPTVVNYPPPTVADNCPSASAACIPPSGSTFPVGTTTVTCTATDESGNSASCTFTVTVGTCMITCPANVLTFTSPTDTSCGGAVSYPSPTTSGVCGAVNCAPLSGSFFAVGATTVTCTTGAGPSCSFTVTVVDITPPRVFCPPNISTVTLPGQSTALVNYPAATATDNCTGPSVECSPPSGSRFPVGFTLVTCTATDLASNTANCFFSITVSDGEPPVIRCPANVSVGLPSGQTSAVVTYPPPTVSDNLPGVNVVCSPASGSSFPAGVTTVTCTATDAGGNRASCAFTVSVGGPQAKVTIGGNKTVLEFAADPTRKAPKPKKSPCSLFTIQNIGFSPLVLTFESLKRTGTDVTNGRITDPNDLLGVAEIARRFFVLSVVNPDNPDQSLGGLGPGSLLTFQPGETKVFCLRFAALIPGLAGKTTGLAASDVLPDLLTSTLSFRQNAGANIEIPILAHVSTALVLVNLVNPRTPPEVIFTRSGDNITVSYAVFDSNLDVSRAKYEFVDSSGQVVAGPFEIDLAAPIRSLNLVKGQSFSVDQKFTGASSNPDVTGVRLTVFDGETSVSAPSSTSATSFSAASIQLMNRTGRVTLYLPDVGLSPRLP